MTTAKPKPAGLFAKLLVAQADAQAVELKGRNEGQKYDYARAADVIAEAQRALHNADLVGYVVLAGPPVEREIQSGGGTGGLFVTVAAKLIVVDPDSDDEPLEIEGRGTGVDYPGDKALYKAMTGAAKYLYAGALGIPFGDDPEAETGDAGRDRAPARGADANEERPATAPQKRNLTRVLNLAQVPDERQRAIVHALAGEPPTLAGVSALLDRLMPAQKMPAELAAVVAELHAEAGVDPAEGADNLPVDVDNPEAAPTLEDAVLESEAEAEQLGVEAGDEPPFPTDEERGE